MADRANAKSDPAAWIGDCIRDYAASGENSLRLDGGREPAWDEPLVGFSRGGDPLYQRFKEDIGPFFWTPPEVFTATFPDIPAAP
ncbi:MAG: epoxyqueuosine reductase, partial [Proteobacteria bacterium]|nr:epoxyqueuosine reductase [Pseudomonadota bacterium]